MGRKFGYKKGDLPVTEIHCDQNISLPIFDYMPLEIVNKIIEKVNIVLDILETKL